MPDDGKSLKEQLNSWLGQLKLERQTYEDFWTDVKDYVIPERGRFIKSITEDQVNDGRRKDQKRINSDATQALKVMANGLQSGLTSKARPWISLESPDPRVNKLPHIKEYLNIVTQALMQVYSGSNIYNCFLSEYLELGGFGVAAMTIYEHPTKTLFGKTYTAGEFWTSYNDRNELDAFFSVMYMTVKQMVNKFGEEKVSRTVKQKFENKQFNDKIEVIQAIIDEPQRLGLRVPNGMPIAEVYYESHGDQADKKLLRIRGFRSFPTMVVRWDTVGSDNYGYSPTKDVIGDIKGMQKMERDSLQGIAKEVNPPLQGPPEMERRGINASPGGYNAVSNMQQNGPAISPLYGTQLNVQGVEFKIGQYTQRIKSAYYNDLFRAISNQDTNRRVMTATEVATRNDEAFLILGPVLERIQYELLTPAITRSIQILYSAGLIPDTPAEILETGLRAEYISILSQAQKAVATAKIQNTMSFAGSLMSVFPQIKNAVDPYKALSEWNYAVGTQPGIIVERDVYDEANAREAEAMNARQEAETGKIMSEGARNLSQTDPEQIKQTIAAVTGGGIA